MKILFVNRTFRNMLIASVASQLGTTIGNIAFAFYLLDRYINMPIYAILAELMYSLPTLVVFFIVGVVADRFDRKKIAENTGWIRAGLTLLLILFIYLNYLPVVFAILFIRSAVAKFFSPAEVSLLQGVLNKEEYLLATGLFQMIFGVFMLFGVSLGGIAYTFLGVIGALSLDVAGFIISATLMRLSKIHMDIRLPNGKTRLQDVRMSMVIGDFKEGLLYILKNRLLLSIICGYFILGFFNGFFSVLPMLTMKYKLAPDDYKQFASLFAIFLGVGFLVGSMVISSFIKKVKPYKIIIIGLLISGVMVGALGTIQNVWTYLILVFLAGTVFAPLNIAVGGWVQELIDKTFMGRVTAWVDPLMMLAHSTALGGVAFFYPKVVGLEYLYYSAGIALLLISLMYALTLPLLVREKEQSEAALAATG